MCGFLNILHINNNTFLNRKIIFNVFYKAGGALNAKCIVTQAHAAGTAAGTAPTNTATAALGFRACAQRVASTSFTDTTDWWINEIKELKNDAL